MSTYIIDLISHLSSIGHAGSGTRKSTCLDRLITGSGQTDKGSWLTDKGSGMSDKGSGQTD